MIVIVVSDQKIRGRDAALDRPEIKVKSWASPANEFTGRRGDRAEVGGLCALSAGALPLLV